MIARELLGPGIYGEADHGDVEFEVTLNSLILSNRDPGTNPRGRPKPRVASFLPHSLILFPPVFCIRFFVRFPSFTKFAISSEHSYQHCYHLCCSLLTGEILTASWLVLLSLVLDTRAAFHHDFPSVAHSKSPLRSSIYEPSPPSCLRQYNIISFTRPCISYYVSAICHTRYSKHHLAISNSLRGWRSRQLLRAHDPFCRSSRDIFNGNKRRGKRR